MAKYIDCKDCQNQYDCERTHLGGCTDGKEFEEEKKLTDEEIVKALENTKNTLQDLTEEDDDYEKLLLVKKITNCSLDLIHRLQSEKAEYERKLADGELVSIDWHNEQVLHLEEKVERYGHRLSETQYALSVCQDENAEQKAEIERLTEERDKYKEKWQMAYMNELNLQKQVDELIKSQELIFERTEKAKQQAIKDVAKEILLPLIDCEKQIDPLKTGIRWSVLKGFCKKFGIEVE
jgi:hypothetical protein